MFRLNNFVLRDCLILDAVCDYFFLFSVLSFYNKMIKNDKYTVSHKYCDHIINDCNFDTGPQNYASFYQVIVNKFNVNAKKMKKTSHNFRVMAF